MSQSTSQKHIWWPRPLIVAALLTWVAGFVDAVGFLLLGQIYTANMSGNSVSFGIGLAWLYGVQIIRRGVPIGAYVFGLLFCRLLIMIAARQRFRRIASVAFAIEIVLLLGTAANASSGMVPSLVFTGLLAIAMGIQNAALMHFGNLTLHTGFVTGTLVKIAENLTKYLTWLWDELWSSGAPKVATFRASLRERYFQRTVWLIGLWWAYAIGAAAGTLTQMSFKFTSLLVAAGPLAALIVVDLQHPLAIQEEREEIAA